MAENVVPYPIAGTRAMAIGFDKSTMIVAVWEDANDTTSTVPLLESTQYRFPFRESNARSSGVTRWFLTTSLQYQTHLKGIEILQHKYS